MARIDFTYDAEFAGHLWAQVDGRALIEGGEIVEVHLEDLRNSGFFVVGGDLERDIKIFLYADPFYRARIEEAIAADSLDCFSHDREMACGLRAAE